jgi:hypothetical protein
MLENPISVSLTQSQERAPSRPKPTTQKKETIYHFPTPTPQTAAQNPASIHLHPTRASLFISPSHERRAAMNIHPKPRLSLPSAL